MASFSLVLFSPPWRVQTLIEEKHPQKSGQSRISNKIIFSQVKTEIIQISKKRWMNFMKGTQGFLVSYCSSEGITTMTRSHPYQSTKRSRQVAESSCSQFEFCSCGDTAIAGYWVGPDIDDGWGFVKAFVNQIS